MRIILELNGRELYRDYEDKFYLHKSQEELGEILHDMANQLDDDGFIPPATYPDKFTSQAEQETSPEPQN